VFDPCRINVTSETFRHAVDNLFGEIVMWRKRMASPSRGDIVTSRINDTERHYMTVLNPSPYGGGEAFSGMHSEMTVYWFDEASAVPETHYTNALKNCRKIFALANPRITEGWFRDMFKPLRGNDGTKEEKLARENTTGYCIGRKGRRYCCTIASSICLNVRERRLKDPVSPNRGIDIEGVYYEPGAFIPDDDFKKVKALLPGQIDLSQHESIIDTSKETWEVECYAHAAFPSEDPIRQAILASCLEFHIAAYRRNKDTPQPITCFGLDVARSKSGDDSCLTAGNDAGVVKQHRWKDDSNVRHVKRILKIAKEHHGANLRDGNYPVCIDMGGGYGGGVADRLRELGVWVIEMHPSGSATTSPIYANARAEWYLLLSRRLDPSDNWQGFPFAIPDDSNLVDELTAPVKILKPNGRYQLESKETIAKRLGRSPDSGDSLVCFFRAVFERYALLERMLAGTADPMVSTGYEPDGDDYGDDAELPTEVDDIADIPMVTPLKSPMEEMLEDMADWESESDPSRAKRSKKTDSDDNRFDAYFGK